MSGIMTNMEGLSHSFISDFAKVHQRFETEYGVVVWCWQTTITMKADSQDALDVAASVIRSWNDW